MELSHIGTHCAVKDCHQKDFLPFKCSHCAEHFCSKHFRFEAHACKSYRPPRPAVAAICPKCNRSVLQDGKRSADALLAAHQASGECCRFRVRKPFGCSHVRPSVKRCRRRGWDQILCKLCGKNHCIKHRFPEDHTCTVLAKNKSRVLMKHALLNHAMPASKPVTKHAACRAQTRRARPTNLAQLSRLVK